MVSSSYSTIETVREFAAPQKTCKRCQKVALSGQKCKRCDTVSHYSCVKNLKNVIILNSDEIICCESDLTSLETETDFYDAIDKVFDKEKNSETYLISYVIKQKDILIKELYDKIELLQKHIKLLNDKKDQQIIVKHSTKSSVNTKTNENKQTNRKNSDGNSKNIMTNEKGISPKINKTTSNSITNLEKSTEEVMTKLIAINDDIPEKISDSRTSKSKSQWTTIGDRKSKKPHNSTSKNTLVIGKNSNNSQIIKGVPKQIDLHVYRVKPNTSPEAMRDFLKNQFPEVICDPLESKYPSLYSSFRVRIYEKNLEKAMNPDVWPEDACIRRFFQRRRKKEESN